MALATLTQFKLLRGVTDTTNDTLFTMLLTNAQSDIESFCDRKFEKTTYTEFYSGSGLRQFALRSTPGELDHQSLPRPGRLFRAGIRGFRSLDLVDLRGGLRPAV
jgi:hypothetical protein